MRPIKRIFRLGRWEVTILFRDLGREPRSEPEVGNIINIVTLNTGIPLKAIKSASRSTEIFYARVLLTWHLREVCHLNTKAIARIIHKDHTAVSYECRIYPTLLKVSKRFRELAGAVTANLVGGVVPDVPRNDPGSGPGGSQPGSDRETDASIGLPKV